MKKIKYILLSTILLVLISCNTSNTNINIVTTIFPLYDWTNNIVDEVDCNVELICDTKTEIHSFTPSVADIAKITNADLFIYVGGDSDTWVKDIKCSEKTIIINLMDELEDLLLDTTHNHDGHIHEIHDEHIYNSLDIAIHSLDIILDKLIQLDSDNLELYTNNYLEYKNKLINLDNEYKLKFNSLENKEVIIADRFPFIYLFNEYDIHYHAAFEGCSSDTNATFEMIKELTDLVNEINPKYLFVLESSDKKLANTVINNSNYKNIEIKVLNSLQTTSLNDYNNGLRYINIMEDNLRILYESLK